MRWAVIAMCVVLFFIVRPLLGLEPADRGFTKQDLYESMVNLHRSKDGKSIIWNECGHRVGKNYLVRAREYTDAIMASIEDVYQKTGFKTDPRIVRAILFRESSDNECCVGKQEIDILSQSLGEKVGKKDLVRHLRRWSAAWKEAKDYCNRRSVDSLCRGKYVKEKYPHYYDVSRWDVGVAQYRWPSKIISNRQVVLPSGRVISKTNISTLMDYEVSIQYLVEDLATYHEACKDHEHWVRGRWGKRRRLSVDEAYYVHHNTGVHSWSETYWKRIGRHLQKIDKMKAISLAKRMRSTGEIFF